jgi:hypothetical protein
LGKALAAFLAFNIPLLAACSGGGGGGSSVATTPPPTPAAPTAATSGIPINLQPAKTTVAYPAAAVTAIGASKGMGNVTIAAAGQGASVTLRTDASGNLSSVVIPAGSIDHTVSTASAGLNLTSPGTLDFTFQLNDTLAFTDEQTYTLSQVAAGQGLTSSAYGLWASTGKTLPGDAGAFAFGNLTPATSVPTTGSATYNGFTIGAGGAINGGATYSLKGNAQIIANFASQTVTTNLTNFVTGSYTTTAKISVPDLAGTSTITGNAYTGPISGGGLTGTINGNFYGSAAQETAGVWQASGGANAWIGSFGAK